MGTVLPPRTLTVVLIAFLLAGGTASEAETGRRAAPERAAAQATDTTEVVIDAVTGLQYDPARFRVPVGGPVEMVIRNADDIFHNLVVTAPGARTAIVEAAAQLGSDQAFVPDTSAVLHATAMLEPNGVQVLRFDAPEEEGVYPYVCTYPGHGVVMYGAMYVGSISMPPASEDPNLPERARQLAARRHQEDGEAGPGPFPRRVGESGHPYPLRLPTLYRTFLPRTTPAAVAVGLTGGESYAFDAGVSYLRYAWHGGFVDNSAQWAGNGDAFSEVRGEIYYEAEDGFPLRFGDREEVPEPRFLGYSYDEEGIPTFRYRAAGVTVRETVVPREEGPGIERRFELEGAEEAVYFHTGSPAEGAGVRVEVSAGTRAGAFVRLDPEEAARFSAQIARGGAAEGTDRTDEEPSDSPGAGAVPPMEAEVTSEKIRGFPYRIETIPTPDGLVPETGGVDFFPDGRLVAAFRRGEILTYDPSAREWAVFATGLHDPLGLTVVSEREVIVGQRPEITRVTDTDGDGRAERFETLTDEFGMSGNYSEFTHGPVMDEAGNLYFSLNTASNNGPVRAITRGAYSPAGRVGRMFSAVPYRGWVMRLGSDGTLTPWASGFRSPNGLALDREGRLFVPDNQGDWLGTSKLFHVQRGNFHGHPSSLAWEPGFDRNPLTVPIPTLQKMRERAAVLFPHQILSNSPTQPVFDYTGGAFGPFEGQLFVGEMNHPVIMRVVTEEVNGQMQGVVFPFVNTGQLRIGNNRMTFGPNGSLWIGQTDHGWPGDRGLQRVVWTGVTPFGVDSMAITREGFELTFTRPVDPATVRDTSAFEFKRFFYRYGQSYGSGRHDLARVAVEDVELGGDRRRVRVDLETLESGYVYQLRLREVRAADGTALVNRRAFYTVNNLLPPAARRPGIGGDSRALNR